MSLIGISIPIFFLGLILKYIFSVRLHWLPSVGREDVLAVRPHPTNFYLLDAILNGDAGAFWDTIRHLILPAIALGSIPLAIVARITRASVLDVQNEDYVRTARAKGLRPSAVDRRHVMRNALLPISTIIGLQLGAPALGRGADRDGLRLARGRQLAEGRDLQSRLPRAPRRDPLPRRCLRGRQPARGHFVRGHQPPDQALLMSVAEHEARELETNPPGGSGRSPGSGCVATRARLRALRSSPRSFSSPCLRR